MVLAEMEIEVNDTGGGAGQTCQSPRGEGIEHTRPQDREASQEKRSEDTLRDRKVADKQVPGSAKNGHREIRTRSRPLYGALAEKSLPQDPSIRVTNLLSGAIKYFAARPGHLPAEAMRLQHCPRLGDLLEGLDRLLHDRVLDAYLRQHPKCLHILRNLFSCRHRYLLHPDLNADHADASRTADQQAMGLSLGAQRNQVFVSQVGPLSEAFKSNSAASQAPRKQAVLVPDLSLMPQQMSKKMGPGGRARDCIEAYSNFEPVTAWEDWALKFSPHQEHVSAAELEVARKIYALQRLIAYPSMESLRAAVSAMPGEFRKMLYGTKADKAIIEDLSERIRANELVDRIKNEGSIELKLDFDCPIPTADELPPKHVGVSKAMALSAAAKAKKKTAGIATVEEYGRYNYKGSTIPLPQVLLPWAINFLADEDVDRTVGWAAKFAELTEYLAHLHHSYAFEDWGCQMKEAVGMLKTHSLYEKHHYDIPKVRVEFPVNMWPKESRRLPRLPGPDVELRKESDDQKDLKGPRLLQHLDVASVHDQQYEMPLDVLSNCYLTPHWEDAMLLWNNKMPAHPGDQNLAGMENEFFEGCMRNGIVIMARFLNSNAGRFRLAPEDVTESQQSQSATSQSLESFVRFRGAKRAALQQCLNVFNAAENHQLCNASRTLILPAPLNKAKFDPGIVYPSHLMESPPPKKVRRDPWAYTRAHRRYRREEADWAAWTRKHTIKSAWKLKLRASGSGPVMELPESWKGLHAPDVMDDEMKRRYQLLRRCEIIKQGLTRAARRAPRPLISGLVEMVDAGLRGRDWQDLNLAFATWEFTTERADELALIRPSEAMWLEYMCQPSRNRRVDPKQPVSRIGSILNSRVRAMLLDISPCSLFRDMEPKSMDEFLDGVNAVNGGPVKRHRFTRKEVLTLAPILRFMKVLKVSRKGKELVFARPETEFHPELLIVWPNPEETREEECRKEEEEAGRTADAAGRRSVAASDSTALTVPACDDDFIEYLKGMPRREDVRDIEDYIRNPINDPAGEERTNNFLRCLAYRMGQSLRGLKSIHEQDLKIIQDPIVRQRNAAFLDTMLDVWSEDTRTRPNNPKENPRKTGTHRETLTLPDVVKMADPDQFREEWTNKADPCRPNESAARVLVRENLVRELSENKTMIWPLQLPYDRRVAEYKVPHPNPPLCLPDEYVGKDKAPLRREPIWTFAGPSRKGDDEPQFWDLNNWPLSTLSREVRERVQSRGPKKRQGERAGGGDQDKSSGSGSSKTGLWNAQADAVPYWKKGEEKRVFVPGPAEYWAGDTPLQRKMVEKRIRQRFERRRPQKRGWTERIANAFFGTSSDRRPYAPPDEDLVLPDVDPSYIPESRPAKRPRLHESFDSVASSQDPLLAVGPSTSFASLNGGGEGGVGKKARACIDEGMTVAGADNNVVMRHEGPESSKSRRLVAKLAMSKERASVTYVVPDGSGEGEDPPMVLYYKPGVVDAAEPA